MPSVFETRRKLAYTVAADVLGIRCTLTSRLFAIKVVVGAIQASLVDNRAEIRKAWRLAHPKSPKVKLSKKAAKKRTLTLRRLNRQRTEMLTLSMLLVQERESILRMLGTHVAALSNAAETLAKTFPMGKAKKGAR